MCVLLLRVGPDPLLAANRDERYARPFSGPRRWVADVPFWAPRDEEEGGTWLGVNERGLVAAVTNRSLLPEEPGRASRGTLVAGVLACTDVEAAARFVASELARAPRNPFQLVVLHGGGGRGWIHGPEGTREELLKPGLHVVSNLHDWGSVDLGLNEGTTEEELRAVLADTSPRLPGGYAVCKRYETRGTVCSAILRPGRAFLFAGGSPDATPYEPVAGYRST